MSEPPRTEIVELSPRESLRSVGLLSWSILGVLLLVAIGLWLLYQVRVIFPPLVLALAIIFLLNPLISVLERRGVRRIFGTLAIYLIFFILVFLLGAVLIPPTQRQVGALGEDLPRLAENASSAAARLASAFGVSIEDLEVEQRWERAQEQLLSEVGRITQFAAGAFHVLLIFVLAPFIALYLLIDLPRLQRSFVTHLPPQYKEEWLTLLERTGAAIGGFFRGQLVVAAIVGTLSAIALWIAKVPFWLPLGMIVGFFNIIPLVGPFIGGGIAVVIGAVSGGVGRAFWAAVAMVIVQQIDNHLVSPNVMGRAVRLHPVTIILALLAGGTLAGLFGMLLAVPATAVGKIFFMHYYYRHVLGRELPPLDAQEDDTDAPEDPRAEAPPTETPVPAAAKPGGVVEKELVEAEEEHELPSSVPSTGRRGRRARGEI